MYRYFEVFMAKNMILIIDDEVNIRNGLALALKDEGYEIQVASSAQEGLEKLALFLPDLIICDVRMPDMDGIKFLEIAKTKYSEIPIVMLTGHAGIDNAITAMKLGAYDFITKPVHLDKLFLIIQRAIANSAQQIYTKNLEQRIKAQSGFERIIGNSPIMQKIIESLEQIAPTDASVLILGESGVGKEIIASSIHENSHRSTGPFIKVHCASLPETLLESELFGHEKGAFTGATLRRKGRFERANGGTLFLDEVGEISPSVQVKLLRVLQEREFERVGGDETIQTDIRIIAATNKNLQESIKNGAFREDLYYRLSVINLEIPSLRNRKEDIPTLALFFLDKMTNKHNKDHLEISPEVLNALSMYSWPGNIRELENTIETMVVLSKNNTISISDLPAHIRS